MGEEGLRGQWQGEEKGEEADEGGKVGRKLMIKTASLSSPPPPPPKKLALLCLLSPLLLLTLTPRSLSATFRRLITFLSDSPVSV